MGERGAEEAAGGSEDRIGLGRASLGLSLVSAVFYAPLLLMSLYFWRYPQSVPDDAPGLALYMLAAPLAILGLPVLATLLGLWCLLHRGRDRRHAAGAVLCCAAVLLVMVVVTPWVVYMPERFIVLMLDPESLDNSDPEPIRWVRGQEYELAGRSSLDTFAAPGLYAGDQSSVTTKPRSS